jgi:SAM-dependent methyltransferase
MAGISRDFNPSITYPNYLVRHRLLQAIKELAPSLRGKLLDVGCGSKPYKPLFNVEEYIGMDFQGEGHSHENEDIDVFYDGKKIPFSNETFDSVFSSEVFEHVFNLNELLPEINRVMKPGGLILITCPFAICEHEAPNDYARYTSFALKYLFEKNGFEIIRLEKTGNSVETIYQLWLMYVHQHITPVFRKIPGVRSAFRIITYSLTNAFALVFSKILPNRNDLYLNNIILCRKKQGLPL